MMEQTSNSNPTNHTVVFDRLWHLLSELHQTLNDRFKLCPTPPDQPLKQFSNADGRVTGSLQTFTGPGLDWLVYSNLNHSPMGFSTMRLSAWLSSEVWVPHLMLEFGTMPDVFFYMDYVPRIDLWTDPGYTEKYYKPLNEIYLTLRDRSDLSLFVSKGLYVRQFQSPAHLCFKCPATEDTFALLQTTAKEVCDRWFTWLDHAESVPLDMQAALAKRDLQMRRVSAEYDPGNITAAKIFGSDLANQLVNSLWNNRSTFSSN